MDKINDVTIQLLKGMSKAARAHHYNYVEYLRDRAMQDLSDFCGLTFYGTKHLENKLTAFIQLCWFHENFSEDKRLAHYSNMIISSQMTREKVIQLLSEPLYDEEMMRRYTKEVKGRLQISNGEFD